MGAICELVRICSPIACPRSLHFGADHLSLTFACNSDLHGIEPHLADTGGVAVLERELKTL